MKHYTCTCIVPKNSFFDPVYWLSTYLHVPSLVFKAIARHLNALPLIFAGLGSVQALGCVPGWLFEDKFTKFSCM